jgi:transcriptional regulator with XRE-family HTH domain
MKLRIVLGDVLRELRQEKGWTLRKLSVKSDISLGYLSELERGQKEASSEVLASLANALAIPLHQIIIEVGHRIQLESIHTYESVENQLTASTYK